VQKKSIIINLYD